MAWGSILDWYCKSQVQHYVSKGGQILSELWKSFFSQGMHGLYKTHLRTGPIVIFFSPLYQVQERCACLCLMQCAGSGPPPHAESIWFPLTPHVTLTPGCFCLLPDVLPSRPVTTALLTTEGFSYALGPWEVPLVCEHSSPITDVFKAKGRFTAWTPNAILICHLCHLI